MTKAEIQLVKSLGDKRARIESGLFVAEGEKLVAELCASHLKVHKIFTTEDIFRGGNVEILSPKEMERITMLKNANNSLALVEMPHYELNVENLRGRLILALDDIQNPGNMGTIIRLADWFGIEDIVCSESTADCFNPKVVQATMGAILRVKVHYTNLPAFLEAACLENMPVFGTFLEGENIYDSTLSASGVIVMGNEGRGTSADVAKYVSHKLFIPPYPVDLNSSESLNVAVATAIVCSEFRRRR